MKIWFYMDPVQRKQTNSPYQSPLSCFAQELIDDKMLRFINFLNNKFEENLPALNRHPFYISIRENTENINKFIEFACHAYNLYTSFFAYSCSFAIGFLSSSKQISASLIPEKLIFKILSKGPLFDCAIPDGEKAFPIGDYQKMHLCLTIMNWYLGSHYFEDWFFVMISGIFVGNTFFHHYRENCESCFENVTTFHWFANLHPISSITETFWSTLGYQNSKPS